MNKLNKSKRLDEELWENIQVKAGKNDNLSLRTRKNDTKIGHDELVEKFKIKQRTVFPFLRESTRETEFYIEDIEKEINDKCEFDVQRK